MDNKKLEVKAETAQELLDWLQTLPEDKLKLPVELEGCDCFGNMSKAGIFENLVVLYRS